MAPALLADTLIYTITVKEAAIDFLRLKQLKKALLALYFPQGRNKVMREAFHFAVVDSK